MDVTEISSVPVGPPAIARGVAMAPEPAEAEAGAAAAAAETFQHCDECGAPVAADQRYCVACGAHRRHVDDPAARYLSQATARSRASRSAATAQRSSRSGGRSHGLGAALVLALVPVAAAVGMVVGRSSNNNDAKLIQALERRQAVVAASGTSATTATGAAGGTVPAVTVSHTRAAGHGKSRKRTSSTSGAGKSSSATHPAGAPPIVGFKPTPAQVQQGAQVVQRIQKSAGKSYVNSQSNLPSTIVVP